MPGPWPIDKALDAGGNESLLEISDQTLRVEIVGPGHVRVDFGGASRIVGLPQRSSRLRVVPDMGPLPLLLLPDRGIICSRRSSIKVYLSAPLYLKVGAGSHDELVSLADIPPIGIKRALYGPVDAGVICRAARCAVETSSPSDPPSQRALAYLALTIENKTGEPLEVNRLMIPLSMAGIHQDGVRTWLGAYQLRLLSAVDAELTYLGAPAPGYEVVADLAGKPLTPLTRPVLFTHTYRAKTGLEFGF